ncbi:ABC transporter G member 20 [Ranunculus cassubicifolius]
MELQNSLENHIFIDRNSAAEAEPPHVVLQVRDTRSPHFVLYFSNLTYSVKTGRKMTIFGCRNLQPCNNIKTLLNDISGEARDGEILAVVGASGSGKTTLIDALANRIAKGSLKGSLTLNGEALLDSPLLKALSAYVMQEDLLFPMLTVEETLMFSAEFRLPRSLSKSKKRSRVQALINQLGLGDAANTVVGNERHRGLSGGERRRVSIGVDIIHDPILLFLDEPTSGLDSTSAFLVVKVLQGIAQSGSIVVMSVHQPSYRLLGLLDSLILLSRGRAVFNGSPKNLQHFFTELGHPIPEKENWIEFALDFVREQEKSSSGTKIMVELNTSWRSRRHYQCNIPEGIRSIASISRDGKMISGLTFANTFWTEILVLSRRTMLNSKRMPELFGIRMAAVIATGFILATVYWQLDSTPKGAQERFTFLSFVIATTFFTCAEALPTSLHERYIFMRETRYNTYRRSSYVVAYALVALPALVLLSLVFAVITFWPVGLSGGISGFLFYFFTILASFWAGTSLVTFLSGVVTHVMVGYTVVVGILAYFLLFSGSYINRDRIPAYWIWFHYISLMKYPFEGVMQNEFDDPQKCFVTGSQLFDSTFLGTMPSGMKNTLFKALSEFLGVNITGQTCVMSGVDIMRQQGVSDLTKWSCLWITVAWGFFYRAVFYLSLLCGSKNKRM